MYPTEPTEIVLDRPRRLRLTFRAMREIKEGTGVDMLNTGSLEGVTPDQFPIVLAAMLRHEDRELTPETVEDLLDVENIGYVLERMKLCLQGSMPERAGDAEPSDEEGQEDPNAPAA